MIGIVLAPILAIFGFLADNIWLTVISIAIAIFGVRASVLNMNRTYTMIYFGVLFITITLMIIGAGDEEEEPPEKTAQTPPPRTTYKPRQPVVKSPPPTRPTVTQKRVTPTQPTTTKKEAVAQAPLTLDEPDTTTVFTPQRKPRVPRGFIAKQKARAKVALKNSYETRPCDRPSKLDNFELTSGTTIRVKVCFDVGQLKIKLGRTRSNNVQVTVVNVQGQRSRRRRSRPENFMQIHHLQLLGNKLILRPKNTVMKRGGVEYVVVDVTLR